MPAYLDLGYGELKRRAEQARELARSCSLCPRDCGADRVAAGTGWCRAPGMARVASFGPHFGEEPELVGDRGSGTIFFSCCNLSCVFCQNHSISHGGTGHDVTTRGLARMMLELQSRDCHNINLVTPTPHLPWILAGLAAAVQDGLSLPLVYNCGGYEAIQPLSLLDGIVDIYLPDLKYGADSVALRLSGVRDYVSRSRAAIAEMHRQVGTLETDESGIAVRGLMVRHLVLPGGLSGSDEVFDFVARELGTDTYVNIMGQYGPDADAKRHPPLDRPLSRAEFDAAVAAARAGGLTNVHT